MNLRRVLAIIVLIAPVGLAFWGDSTMKNGELMPAFSAPQYADATQEQLAAVFAEMDGLWRMALANYQLVFWVFLSVLVLFALALATLLWRSPPNKAFQTDGSRPAGEPRR